MRIPEFGTRLRNLRVAHNLNQDVLAEELQERFRIRISQSYVSYMENKGKIPSGEVIAGLAKLLNTSADYLLVLTSDPSPSGDLLPLNSTQAKECARVIDRLPEAKQREILEVVLAMARHSQLTISLSEGDRSWPPRAGDD